MRVAFFGGSFNPPHVGHVLTAAYARSLGFDRVLAVVVQQHAFGKRLASFEDRLQMARLAFAPVTGAEVSDVEAQLPVPSYTLQTLEYLRGHHPNWEFRLLLGSDAFATLDQWHEAERLRRLAPPFVVGRAGHPTPEGLPNVLPEVSSSEIRERLAQRPSSFSDDWLSRRVPSAVLDWIAQRGLYGASSE